jgi:hypothetical protein
MDERMTLEQVRDEMRARENLAAVGPVKDRYKAFADAIDAHLAQPAQAVDVVECDNCGSKDGCACARVGIGSGSHLCAACKQPVTLTRAIGNAQAEGE